MAVAHSTASTTEPTKQRRGRPPKRPAPACKAGELPASIPNLDEAARRALQRALTLLEKNAVYRVEVMSSTGRVRDYLRIRLAHLEHEEFHVLWLDSQNRLIASERLFSGTLSSTSVYPREVVKAALKHNAAACILAHNHPSGIPEPSSADLMLTRNLKSALAVVDVRVLDHFIVAGNASPLSFAERGEL